MATEIIHPAFSKNPSARQIKAGDRFMHFKGNTYEALTTAAHTETGEILVIYKALKTGLIWARPLSMFNSEVDHKKYPDVKQKMRFELITENKNE